MNQQMTSIPMVATDLSSLEQSATDTRTDVTVNGRAYRRIDPEYYAWLRSRMDLAQTAHDKGRLSTSAFDELRSRFNSIHDQAVALFGESVLLEAIQQLDPKGYQWPGHTLTESMEPTRAEIPEAEDSESRCSSDSPDIPRKTRAGPRRFEHAVSEDAVTQVDAIRDDALALGWTESDLYQTRGTFRFPCGNDYGVVCFIDQDQRLGKVTERAIEIITRTGHSLHFYRKEVSS